MMWCPSWYSASVVLFFFINTPAFPQSISRTPSAGTPTVSPHDQATAHDPLRTCVPTPQHSSETELYQKRLEEYLKARGESPQNAEVHYNLGILYSRLQQWDEAQKSFLQALSHDRDKKRVARIYFQLGNVFACQRQFEKAIVQYKQTLRMEPQDTDTQHNLALSQLLSKQQQREQQQQSRGNSDENREKNESQQHPSLTKEQPESYPDHSPTEKPPEKENSQQNQEENSRQESDAQQERQSRGENSTEEQSIESDEGGGKTEEEDTIQAALTRQQAAQLLNSVPEDRRRFMKNFIDRQTQTPPPSEKNW